MQKNLWLKESVSHSYDFEAQIITQDVIKDQDNMLKCVERILL